MPSFIEFNREDSHVVPDEPMFTLQRRGLISLNQAAFKALGEPAAVALMYDPAEGIIALRKVPRTYHNGYHVRKQANSRSYLVGAQGFTSFNKINTDAVRRFVGRKYDDQMLVSYWLRPRSSRAVPALRKQASMTSARRITILVGQQMATTHDLVLSVSECCEAAWHSSDEGLNQPSKRFEPAQPSYNSTTQQTSHVMRTVDQLHWLTAEKATAPCGNREPSKRTNPFTRKPL